MKNISIYRFFLFLFSFSIPGFFILISSTIHSLPITAKTNERCNNINMISCFQTDLVVCNYGNVLSFVDALIAELNNQLNNCGGALVNCNQANCCYNYAYFEFTTQLNNGKNPYFYCTNESCSAFTCSGTFPGGGSQHNDLTVADQNAILTAMRTTASNAEGCGANNSQAITQYLVYRTGPTGSCSADGPCYNTQIKLRVTYLCTCQQ
ncbi:MAG: hypothetical protein U0V49_03245 [Saprospiraceae bacterium]